MSNLPEVIEAPLDLLAENFSATIPEEEHDGSETISPDVLGALSAIEEAAPRRWTIRPATLIRMR